MTRSSDHPVPGSTSGLTPFRAPLYDRPAIGGARIRGNDDKSDAITDFERLERVVLELAARYGDLRRENERLSSALHESQQRVGELEVALRAGNQLRSDVAKRIDDLVGQIDQIEERFAARGN